MTHSSVSIGKIASKIGLVASFFASNNQVFLILCVLEIAAKKLELRCDFTCNRVIDSENNGR